MQRERLNLNQDEIRARAIRLGFSFAGFAKASQSPHFSDYLDRVSNQEFGDLAFLKKPYVVQARENPAGLLHGAKTILVLGVCYPPAPSSQPGSQGAGKIAAYALLPDYHRVIKEKARQLVSELKESIPADFEAKIFIDSGPLMEKDMAYMAGLGWIGKHTLMIHQTYGSFFLICCILVNIELDLKPEGAMDLCGACQKCSLACPTGCIDEYSLDITRCVSYLTIEHQGVIPRFLRKQIGTRIFGCDTCQIVCPRNKNLPMPENGYFFNLARTISGSVDLSKELQLSPESFDRKYSETPIKRIGFERYLRNVAIAAGNSRNIDCIPGLKRALTLGSDLISAHAIWALNEYQDKSVRKFLISQLETTISETVAAEICFVLDNPA